MNEGPQRLRLLGLPVFRTIGDLAALIHVDSGRLTILTRYAERFYSTYRIPKRTGGWRQISQPSRELKGVQAWILRNIIDKLSASPHATAYLPGKRLSDNVSPHSGNRYFLSVDIEDFFPLYSAAQNPAHILSSSATKRRTAALMSRLCTFFRSLPRAGDFPGAVNLVTLRMDRRPLRPGIPAKHRLHPLC